MALGLKMTADEISAFLDAEFPEMHHGGQVFFVERVEAGETVMRLKTAAHHLRPGGTVSGPTQFALADIASYAAVLAHAGPVALAVTTGVTINFLRKPAPGDLIATCRVLKLGRKLVVVDCAITCDGSDDLVAHAVATYALPS
eukprot:gene22190-biopygen13407